MLYGIQSGMVMQRGTNNRCHVWFRSDHPVSEAHCLNDTQKLTVEPDRDGYWLDGLLIGGPYSLDVGGERLDDIYVGDVWILAGQSNMQGNGRIDKGVQHNANPAIRAYYMQGCWDVARHPLHELARAAQGVHWYLAPWRETLGSRIGSPGIAFARRMYDLTGVPQGVIACAHGGTTMEQWSPDIKDQGPDKSLYAAMLDRFYANGSHVKGMFWYQGCSDTPQEARKVFKDRMISFVEAVRRDMGNIPIVQTQISRVCWAGVPDEEDWSDMRRQQLELNDLIDQLDTVHTVGLELADDIHLEGGALENLGESAAESMMCLLHGRVYGCMPGIRLASVECVPDDYLPGRMTTVVLAYDNVHGQLDGGARPLGYVLSEEKDGKFFVPFQVRVDGRYVYLKIGRSVEQVENSYLWYGYGPNPNCNILDGKQRSLPAMGPIALK